MEGTNYLESCKESLSLVIRNPIRLGIVHGIGDLMQFIGTLFISVTTTLISYVMLT